MNSPDNLRYTMSSCLWGYPNNSIVLSTVCHSNENQGNSVLIFISLALPIQHAVYIRPTWSSTLWQAILVHLITVQASTGLPICSSQDASAACNSLVTTFICLTVCILKCPIRISTLSITNKFCFQSSQH